ncbi:MAG: MoaD/ThiS family protein [Candidatus Hodarchaeales archaeon]|jgi:molybdopterin converting factor small subunit
MEILLVFLGSLQYDLGQMELIHDFIEGTTVKSVVQTLSNIPKFKGLGQFFTDSYESTRSVIVFINDQDISVLEGMDSPLTQGDKLTFIPVIHGG